MSASLGITVRTLIKLLQEQDQNAEVWLEGCDCVGAAGTVVLDSGQLLIGRTDGHYMNETGDES